MNKPCIITLTTDFGLKDPYVGMMKGVILSINPEARIIDISHQVEAGTVSHAAGLIQETCIFFPKGTIHMGVIDPGVGSDRRPILVRTKDHFFIGPDNGLFWPIIKSNEPVDIIHLNKDEYFMPRVSLTFHGRDIFAPVAAHLSRGINPLKMGTSITDPVQLLLPILQQHGDILSGQIIRVDNFGNMITNIRRKDLDKHMGTDRPTVKVGNLVIENVHETYAETKEGELLALIGSSECLEIAVNLGRACDRLEVAPEELVGMKVEVEKKK
jgi:S-adenosylmethionine hydrolase